MGRAGVSVTGREGVGNGFGCTGDFACSELVNPELVEGVEPGGCTGRGGCGGKVGGGVGGPASWRGGGVNPPVGGEEDCDSGKFGGGAAITIEVLY